MKIIPKEKLKDLALYRDETEGARIVMARWHANIQEFVYVKDKFGKMITESMPYPDGENDKYAFFPTNEVKEP